MLNLLPLGIIFSLNQQPIAILEDLAGILRSNTHELKAPHEEPWVLSHSVVHSFKIVHHGKTVSSIYPRMRGRHYQDFNEILAVVVLVRHIVDRALVLLSK